MRPWPRVPGPVIWTAVIALIGVLYMVLVLPLGAAPDEPEHALRIFQLSIGNVFPSIVYCPTHHHVFACRYAYNAPLVPKRRVGGLVPFDLDHVMTHLKNHVTDLGPTSFFQPSFYSSLSTQLFSGPVEFAHFENTVLYSPANYVPQTIVVWLGQKLVHPVLATLFEARLAAGLVWAACVTSAVWLVRRWRWLFALALLVPTELAQAPTLNADSVSFGASALMFAYAMRVADQGAPPSRSQLARLGALALFLGLLKIPIPLIVAAALIVMWPVLGAGIKRWWRAAALAIPAFVAAAWWTLSADKYFVPYRDTVFKPSLLVNISQSGQEHYLTSSFGAIPSLLWNTLTSGNLLNLAGMFGTLGQDGRSGPLPGSMAAVWFIVFGLLIIANHEGTGPSRRVRIGLGLMLIVYLLVTAFSLDLTWTAVGAGQIDGIHGRYFTPTLVILIPMLAGLGGRRLRIGDRVAGPIVMALSAFGAMVLFMHTAHYFYDETPWQIVPKLTSALL